VYGGPGLREPAWAPDGSRVAASVLGEIWIMAPDGRSAGPLRIQDAPGDHREPAWSPDGARLAFSAETPAGFDIYLVPARGGRAERVTTLEGDERWPSWTRDGRIVFAHRHGPQWDLRVAKPGDAGDPVRLTESSDNETQPRVSPDGSRIAFVSDRDSEDGDVELWTMRVEAARESEDAPAGRRGAGQARVTRLRGGEAFPSWSPKSDHLAYYAEREGLGSVWVSWVEPLPDAHGTVARPRPAPGPVLVSRRGGAPAWSPDGRSILIAELPDPEPGYNGNPSRVRSEPPALFAPGTAFRLWSVPAPVGPDEGGRTVALGAAPSADRWTAAFDRVWRTLDDLYYARGPRAQAWAELRDGHRPQAAAARDQAELEAIVDAMIARQPLIKESAVSARGVVSSGHPLASAAGAAMLGRGGNVVDAAIAVSFALGVVEPDASGVGGDGMALLYLKGMDRPVAIDYKDQTPAHATLDNPRIFREGRLVADGPAAANIPGVVAGMDLLYRKYGSGKIPWADLLAPAIEHAEKGFLLDEALPTTIAEGERFLRKHEEARRIFLPGGAVPRPGDRFVNRDYAAMLRMLASDGGDSFYRGRVARLIAADLEANGGVIGYDDLAQYRAIERTPLAGRYRGHAVYGAPPPVPSGASLIETLQILDHYAPTPGATVATDPEYLHHVIESWKARDQIRRVADPDRWPVDLGNHLDPAHAAELFRRIDPARASRYRDDPAGEERGGERIGRGTTGFVVADGDGNMIAITQTLSTWGGTFYVSKGLGFLYNNHLRSNRTTAGAYGQLLPLTRSASTSNPTLVFGGTPERPAPRLAVAAAGNAWITASVYTIVAGVIDGGLDAQQAIEAPRLLIGRDPGDPQGTAARIQIEDRFPRAVLTELERRGHRFQKIGRKGEVRYGYASLALVDGAARTAEAGAEPRRSHAARAADLPTPTQQNRP
jgi:gamma-glutamyltranspeptidase